MYVERKGGGEGDVRGSVTPVHDDKAAHPVASPVDPVRPAALGGSAAVRIVGDGVVQVLLEV